MRSSRFQVVGVLLLLPALVWAQQQPQAAPDLNTITKVNVQGGTIEIVGSRKPSFTTFTMTDPPRLVIDVSEAVFSGVPEEMQVGNGIVTAVKTASYGSGERAIARILVGFSKDVETDIQTQEGRLVVKVLSGGGGENVALGTPPGGQGQQVAMNDGSADAASKAAQQDDKAQQQAVTQAEKSAADDRKQQEADAKAAAKRAEEDRLAQEKAAKDAARKAEEDRRAQEKAAKDAEKSAAEAEKQRKADEAKAAAEAKRSAAEEERQRKADEAKAAAEEKRRKAEEARAAAEEEKRRKAEEKANRGKQVAMAETPGTPPARSEGGPVSVSPRRKTVTFVGFQQEAGASRVFVRTNEPVRYSVSEAKNNLVVLELENTGFGKANTRRPLDTSYFDTAVSTVTSNPQGKAARIEIKLKESVPYQARQEGNEVVLEFPKPAHRG